METLHGHTSHHSRLFVWNHVVPHRVSCTIIYIYNYFDDVDGSCANFSTPHHAIPNCFAPSLQDSSLIRTLHDASKTIYSVSWGGQWLAAGGQDGTVRVYNAAQDGARQQVQGWARRHPK